MITLIVSGGQTGADQAALAVGQKLGIVIGGYAPAGYLTKDGPQPDLLKSYNLIEHEGGYKQRTYRNVEITEGTLRCCVDFFSPGEICTLNAIKRYNKPYFDVYLPNPASHQDLLIWMLRHHIRKINVAGNIQNTKGFDIFSMTYRYLYEFIHYVMRVQNR